MELPLLANLGEEGTNRRAYLFCVRFEREMTGVEKFDLCIRKVARLRFSN